MWSRGSLNCVLRPVQFISVQSIFLRPLKLTTRFYNNNNNNNKYTDLTIETQRNWNVKKKDYTTYNRGDWVYLEVIQKIREQHTR
jgi:hypothetical protein